MPIQTHVNDDLDYYIQSFIPDPIEYYLDVGTAYGQHALNIKAKHKFCNEYERNFIQEVHTPCFYGDVFDMAHYVKPGMFDAVTAFDVIEHFPKDRSVELMDLLESFSKRLVMFFTPYGEYLVGATEPLHSHLCGWLPEDFRARGYGCWVFPKFHANVGAILAVKDKRGIKEVPLVTIQNPTMSAEAYWVA